MRMARRRGRAADNCLNTADFTGSSPASGRGVDRDRAPRRPRSDEAQQRQRAGQSPKRRYGVVALRPAISTSRMPRVNHGSSRELAAVVRDRRRDAGVGRAQHRPAGLERAHRGDLVVLARGDRAAVPRVVGDVDEQRRVARGRDELGAERVLVADVDGDALAGDLERRLVGRPRGLVGERNREHAADEPADDRLQRNRLAERHEVALAIELRRRGAEAHHAVVDALAVAGLDGRLGDEQADEDVAVARARRGIEQAQEHRARDLVGELRIRAFREHDEAPRLARRARRRARSCAAGTRDRTCAPATTLPWTSETATGGPCGDVHSMRSCAAPRDDQHGEAARHATDATRLTVGERVDRRPATAAAHSATASVTRNTPPMGA